MWWQVLRLGFGTPRWRDAIACYVKAGAVSPRTPEAWSAVRSACAQMAHADPALRPARPVYDSLRQLTLHGTTVDAATLVEAIAALEDEFDADAIDWTSQE